jgi:hypothetical protein
MPTIYHENGRDIFRDDQIPCPQPEVDASIAAAVAGRYPRPNFCLNAERTDLHRAYAGAGTIGVRHGIITREKPCSRRDNPAWDCGVEGCPEIHRTEAEGRECRVRHGEPVYGDYEWAEDSGRVYPELAWTLTREKKGK